jgi:menaquinone-dependent protoporphyrinogen oxidase
MTSILVCYGTSEGQTAKIAGRIVETLQGLGYTADAVDVSELGDGVSLDDYDAVLVGASIHVGTHQSEIRAFVQSNRAELAARPNGFFQVCLTAARSDDESKAITAGYIDSFVEATEWQPDRIATFGGALRYSEYGFLKRLMMKRIAKDATGDTDTSRDYEYTDWDEVEQFTTDFAAFVEEQLDAASVNTAPPEADND